MALWLGIEVKRPGPVRWSHAEQERLWRANHTAVARSIEDACAAVEVAERFAFRTMSRARPAVRDLAATVGETKVIGEVYAYGP